MSLANSHLAMLAVFLAAALGPKNLRADTTVVNGRVVIPVDDDEAALDTDAPDDLALKGGFRSAGGQMAQRFQRAVQSGRALQVTGTGVRGQQLRGTNGDDRNELGNVQANDPALDHIVRFNLTPPTRPFEFATQSETSVVRDGKHIVVGYNSSAGAEVMQIGNALFFSQLKFSGFSTSHDGGRTWSSGFLPAVNDAVAPFTFGDPALALDRRGNVFYTSLGTDAAGIRGTLIINKSTDHGSSFGSATVVAVDDGSDKEWLAIGPDPRAPFRDNIYVTWTSFKAASSELWLARSTDGGMTFTSRQLFAPADDGVNSSFIQFSNPVVDLTSGRLFIPFLHFSDVDADNVRVLVSDDGGVTFRFLAFNVPGAVDASAFPNVTPGLINDCRGGGLRNALVAGASQGTLRRGFPIFKQVTRLVSQPHAVAARGVFGFVLNSNVSPFFGDNSQGSEIRLVASANGGRTFLPPLRVAASTAADPQHVHPFLALSTGSNKFTVSYYVQQSDERLRTDVATVQLDGGRLRLKDTRPLSSTAFDLTPSNVLRTPTLTTNFDRTIVSCYDIGEYQGLARSSDDDDGVIAAWGDNRRTWTSPPDSPAVGTHSQADVFTAIVDDD